MKLVARFPVAVVALLSFPIGIAVADDATCGDAMSAAETCTGSLAEQAGRCTSCLAESTRGIAQIFGQAESCDDKKAAVCDGIKTCDDLCAGCESAVEEIFECFWNDDSQSNECGSLDCSAGSINNSNAQMAVTLFGILAAGLVFYV